MNLQNCDYGSINVICFRIRGVVNIDGVSSAGYVDDWCFVEVLWKFLGLESGWGYYDFHLWALQGDIFDESEKNVSVEWTLMSLVNDHTRIWGKVRLEEKLSEKHAIGHVFDDGILRGVVIESDGITDLLA